MTNTRILKRFDMGINLRHARQLFHRAALVGVSEQTGSIVDEDHAAVAKLGNKRARLVIGATAENVHDNTPMAENTDPWKTRIIRRWRTPAEKMQRRIRQLLSLFQRKPLSPEEQREREENLERARLAKFHQAQAEIAGAQMIGVFTRLGLCKKRVTEGRENILDRVWFDVVKHGPMAYYYHVGHFPDGVSVMDLYNDAVCTDLSESVGHRVRSEYRSDNGQGLIFIIEIASSMGIPEFVSFPEMMEVFPQNLPSLAFPAGVASNGRHVRRSLEDMPHLLVAGGTGAGKSNMVNAIICSLIMRNTPDRLKLILFDLKRGVEFWHYEGIPHLQELNGIPGPLNKGIIETIDDVLPALSWIIEEGDSRLDMIKSAGHRDISGYNARRRGPKKLGRLVVIIDEWANIKLMLGTKAEEKLTRITNLYRAAGIHVILATQNPKSEIVNTVVTTNFVSRMAFAMPAAASQTVLGNWHAVGLAPKGRYVYQSPSEEIHLQAPRITDGTITEIVKAARKGSSSQPENLVSLDPEEIMEYSIDNLGGSLRDKALYLHFKDRITLAKLRDLLKLMDNHDYTINGTRYIIVPGEGSRPRMMEITE